MNIDLDKLDDVTKEKYKEFKEKIEKLLAVYQKTDARRFELVKKKIEQTKGNWDTTINLVSQNSTESIDISQLLAYEYCLATERITHGKVPFESMLDKLFEGVQKFRIGNPVPGMDDECLYSKSLNDPTAIPVTSKLYRIKMHAGAQHLEYIKDGKPTGAVFIYEKGTIKGFAQDEHGNPVDMKTEGIDFGDLSRGQSLLTNLRQTVFHEWTHSSENEKIDGTTGIDYEYEGPDKKTYRNYERVRNYVTTENIGSIQEPQYIRLTQDGQYYFKDKEGNLIPADEFSFGLEKKQLETEYCFSTGLITEEVIKNKGTEIGTRMHNIITEGFVEQTARAMIRAIDPQVVDIDETKYPEYVEMAKRVIKARDFSLEDGLGQTYADFLMHSSLLKKDLESRTVESEDKSKVDGLHYISDYADRVQSGKTKKSQFYRSMPDVAKRLNLSKEQVDLIEGSDLWQKRELTEDEQNFLKKLLYDANPKEKDYVDKIMAEYVKILEEDEKFFDGIAKKLGYSVIPVQEVTKSAPAISVQKVEKSTPVIHISQEAKRALQETTLEDVKEVDQVEIKEKMEEQPINHDEQDNS